MGNSKNSRLINTEDKQIFVEKSEQSTPTKIGSDTLPPPEWEKSIRKSIEERLNVKFNKLIETTKKDLKNEIEDKRIDIIQALGIFVALFTFVSINIQIFSNITSLNNALIFVILMFLCLGGFVLLLHAILVKKYFLIIIIFGVVMTMIFISLLPNTPLSIEESSELKKINQRVSNLEKTVEIFLRMRN